MPNPQLVILGLAPRVQSRSGVFCDHGHDRCWVPGSRFARPRMTKREGKCAAHPSSGRNATGVRKHHGVDARGYDGASLVLASTLPLAGKMLPQVTDGGDAAGIEFAEKYPPLFDKSDISPTRGERGGCRTPNSSSSGLTRGSMTASETVSRDHGHDRCWVPGSRFARPRMTKKEGKCAAHLSSGRNATSVRKHHGMDARIKSGHDEVWRDTLFIPPQGGRGADAEPSARHPRA